MRILVRFIKFLTTLALAITIALFIGPCKWLDSKTKVVRSSNCTTHTVRQQVAEVAGRPLVYQRCFFSNFSSLVNNSAICSPISGAHPEMVILITSALAGHHRRQAIRDTWASVTNNNSAHIRHVFLLGTTSQGTVTDDVVRECVRFQDVVVWDFVDSYRNLTYKTMVGLHWIVRHCSQTKFFFKTDQDMYIFPERILNLARRNEKTLLNSLGGECRMQRKPYRIIRGQYYVSYESYPQKMYPKFCSGTGYIGTLNVAREIVATSPNIPFLVLEDVYLGLVLDHLGYNVTPFRGFLINSKMCGYKRSARRIMTIHGVNATSIRRLWEHGCGL